MSQAGLKVLSIFALVLIEAHASPAQVDNQASLQPDEPRVARFTRGSGFVPLVPSQLDPRPNSDDDDDDSHLSPVFAEQNFFPSFYRGQLPPARPFRQTGSSSGRYSLPTKPAFDESILGSGNFAVVRGGTFYPEGESHRRPSHDYFASGSSFDETDHGRPFALPLESGHYSDDPFANFKDFADITAGIESDFSHVVAVYAHKNSTSAKHEPNNILETLEMIDEEKREAEETTAKPKSTKLSKFKSKLRGSKLLKVPKKQETLKKKNQRRPSSSADDYIDPLVADS